MQNLTEVVSHLAWTAVDMRKNVSKNKVMSALISGEQRQALPVENET